LGEFAIETAEAAFEEAQVANLFTDRHIAIRNDAIANCNNRQEKSAGRRGKRLRAKEIELARRGGGEIRGP
jgi:hypothetical protein